MPSTSAPQRRFMAMCSTPKGRAAAKGDCPPAKVAKEFHAADKRQSDAGRKSAASTAKSYGFR